MAVYRRSILWRLDSTPAVRLWSGAVRDLPIPGDGIYRGAGALLDVPALKTLMNGRADRIEFGVSGVSQETLRLALEDRDTVYGARLRIGHVMLDAAYQYVSHRWIWSGTGDVITASSSATETGRQRTISLSVASGDTLRSNPQITRWTDADQRRRSRTDRFFDRVAGISQGTSRRFGPR